MQNDDLLLGLDDVRLIVLHDHVRREVYLVKRERNLVPFLRNYEDLHFAAKVNLELLEFFGPGPGVFEPFQIDEARQTVDVVLVVLDEHDVRAGADHVLALSTLRQFKGYESIFGPASQIGGPHLDGSA